MDVTEQVKQELANLLQEFQGKEQEILNKLTKEERIAIGKPLKEISKLDKFNANGKEYIVRTNLTVTRFEEFEKVQLEVGYGVDFRNMFKNMRKAYDFLNGSQPADAAITLYNMMHSVKNKIEDRENPVLQLCALFICTADEDLTKFDPELTKTKIEDWKTEGIVMDDFFSFAFNLVNSFIPIYNEVSANISEHKEKIGEELNLIRKMTPKKSSFTENKTK